jgi:tetratricopeptide (TPR) repeat protein
MPKPPRVRRLEEIEAVPGPGTLLWHPVRLTLDVRAFGCNAYTAAESGQDVVEPHTEEEHEELYFVATGRARFTIDGEQYDCPAGTYVFLPDPESRREAVAIEPGTTVLSFGGPPTFEPSAWEWAFRGASLMRSDPDRAREIFAEGLEAHPDSATVHYNLACLEAIGGRRQEALAELDRAIALDPRTAAWARDDEDLASLRGDQAFDALTASG